MASTTTPNVVILGGGFAGLYATKALRNSPVHVTLVDRRNHHLFQPMLYQVATAALSPSDIASPIRSILRRQKNVDVLLGTADRIDPNAKAITLADGSSIQYDYCIVATGARHSYFGNDQWEGSAPGLKNLEDALAIRRRILLAFEAAERERDLVRRQQLLTFVVIGGGPTGVEMAGAIAEIRRYALRRDFRHIDPRDASVLLLEGGPRLLTSYPPEQSDWAKQALRHLGVDVRTDTLVTSVDPDAVQAAGWTIPTRTVVWAAGNTASPLTRSLDAPLDRQGRVLVTPECTVPGHPDLFVLGDAAAFEHQGGATLPGICPVAIQMGNYAARAIIQDLTGRSRPPFHYLDKGQLAVIGRGRAVADIRRFGFHGFSAWLAWIFVHIFFLIGFRNRVLVMLQWGWSYFTYGLGARLIYGEASARPPEPRW
ncbi:MAG: NAD(P)/FAD-dependent oxidoreductase [Gemmatimonadales bacterium]